MTPSDDRRRIAALGECMIELRADDGTGRIAFAGDTLNSATYLRRLLPVGEFEIDYVTALGDDPISDQMIDSWRAEGIGTRLVRRLPGRLPGLYLIRTDPDGEREFFYWRSEAAARDLLSGGHHETLASGLSDADLVYLSGISLAILSPPDRELMLELLLTLRGRGARIAYDSNYRPRLWESAEDARALQRRILPAVDIFIGSCADEAELFDDPDRDATIARLTEFELPEWVLRGEPGIAITSTGGASEAVPIDPARVIDTTGAGDSFNAAYLAARLSGMSPDEAVHAGHALAAIVVQRRGAIVPAGATPTLAALVGQTP